MIEIQCTSCQTRYRIDEAILPDDTPTFKCSRCGHVFSAEPRGMPPWRAGAEGARGPAVPAAASAAERPPPRAPQAPPRPAPDPAAVAAARAAVARARQAEAAAARGTTPPPPTTYAEEPARARAPRAQAQGPSPEPPAEPPAESPSVGRDIGGLLRRRFGGVPADEPGIPAQASIPAKVNIPAKPNIPAEGTVLAEASIQVVGISIPVVESGIPPGEAVPGENLAFDFNDERRGPDPSFHTQAEARWEVGDADAVPPPPSRPKPRIRISDIDEDLEPPNLNQASSLDAEQEFARIRPEDISVEAHSLEAELRGRSYKLHSAGYFIGLFALVILGFGILTVVIQSAPIASAGLLSALPVVGHGLEPPISPARRVALGQVQAQYARLKSSQTALVISGTVENLTSGTLGAVRIEAALTASNPGPLRSQAVYCGNSLSSKMIGEMTPHEIEFFEKLEAPKSFTLAPQATAPFVIVFIEPPAGAGHFQLRVLSADPAAAPPPATEGG